MQTSQPPYQPDPLLKLPNYAYYQLYHMLDRILPPPVNGTPEAGLARIHSAIDKVAAMLPTNATEADLAARYVAAGAQADEVMRLTGVHAADIKVFMQLNAQFIALFRASQGALGHLRRMQAVRHKREANNVTCDTDAWTLHVVTRSLQQVADAGPVPAAPAAGPLAPAADEPPALAPAAEPASAAETAPALAAASSSPSSHRMAAPAEADEPPRDLPTEADQYAVIYPRRAREIRRCGGLPPDCSFGPPADELVQAIVTGTSPILRALDGPDAATG